MIVTAIQGQRDNVNKSKYITTIWYKCQKTIYQYSNYYNCYIQCSFSFSVNSEITFPVYTRFKDKFEGDGKAANLNLSLLLNFF